MPYSISSFLSLKSVNKDIVKKFFTLTKGIMESKGIEYGQIIQQVKINKDRSIIMDFNSFEEFNKQILIKDKIKSIIYTIYSRNSETIINKITFSHFVHEFTLLEVEANEKGIAEQFLQDIKNGMEINNSSYKLSENNSENNYNAIRKLESLNGSMNKEIKNSDWSRWLVFISTIIGIIAGAIAIIEFFI